MGLEPTTSSLGSVAKLTGALRKSLISVRFSSSQIECALTGWRVIKHER